MNPYDILNIEPTLDKMAIRRAYVRETKIHHPDQGGDPNHFGNIQLAYHSLINNKHSNEIIETEVRIPLADFLYGCVATAAVKIDGDDRIIKFTVPEKTYPGTQIKFVDPLTKKNIRVMLYEKQIENVSRLDTNIIICRTINTDEAEAGCTITIQNYDGHQHTVSVSPKTTANRLTYYVRGAGFIDRKSQNRGDLTIIIEVTKDR